MPTYVNDFFKEEVDQYDYKKQYYLYHYTSVDALINILNDKQIWLFHANQMNDSSEGKFLLETATNSQDASIYYHLLMKNFYICSFCNYGNLLSQWRAYGNVNIGFSLDAIKTASRFIEDLNGEQLDTSGVQYSECEYINPDDANFEEIIEKIKNKVERIKLLKDANDIKRELLFLGSECFSVKHSGFKEEAESRLIAYLWNRKPFLKGKKKFIKYKFDNTAIKRIVIGPSENGNDNYEKIKAFIESKPEYIDIEIVISKIPFRGI